MSPQLRALPVASSPALIESVRRVSERALAAIVPDVPAGLPATIVERRPDVAAAERRVRAVSILEGAQPDTITFAGGKAFLAQLANTRAGADTPEGAATLLNPPWNFLARERGAKSLGRTIDLFGPYQAQGVFVMRPWAARNASALERYLAAYIEGCRAAQDPALWPHAAAIAWQGLSVVVLVRAGALLFRRRVMKSGPARVKTKKVKPQTA